MPKHAFPAAICIALAVLCTVAAAQTPYSQRLEPSAMPQRLWLDSAGQPKAFAVYAQDARLAIAQYHYALPTGAPAPAEDLASAIGPREWAPQGANCTPAQTDGILLVHGLTDSPYLMRELGDALYRQPLAPGRCLVVRSLLLPGHGSNPGDMRQVRFQDWVAATGYGINSFAGVAAQVHVLGFSTGGALGIYWAYHQQELALPLVSLVLLSPAIQPQSDKAKWPSALQGLINQFSEWTGILRWDGGEHSDQDFAKYESFSLAGGIQIALLDQALAPLLQQAIPVPVYMALGLNDNTINSAASVNAFLRTTDVRNRMLLVAPDAQTSQHPTVQVARKDGQRISVVEARLADQKVVDFAHTAFPVAPGNRHYGKDGDYALCLHYADASPEYCTCATEQMKAVQCPSRDSGGVVYGELPQPKYLPKKDVLRRLTFNPYFERMVGEIWQFLGSVVSP